MTRRVATPPGEAGSLSRLPVAAAAHGQVRRLKHPAAAFKVLLACGQPADFDMEN